MQRASWKAAPGPRPLCRPIIRRSWPTATSTATACWRCRKADRIELGGVIFQYHCNDCHALQQGYSPVAPLVQGWTPDMIRSLIHDLNRTRFTMPPWAGTPEEAELLVSYLSQVSPPRPAGMLPA